MKPRMNYREAIEWLFGTQMFGIKLGLEGPRRLLREYLAFPDHGTRVIHVAGTNGKGSTCAMIDSIARAAGRRCGLFTSPHLIDFRERIQVSGEQIPELECAEMLTGLRRICEDLDTHPTFFEISLALAMRWFRETSCELVVLETGMGGRFDATTAVPADLCVITPIGLDHSEWLGDTIEAIAGEKSGILVEGKPLICAPQEPAARRVIEMEANEKRCPVQWIQEPLEGYFIPVAGDHQRWNAALAVHALHHAGIPLNPDMIQYGLSQLQWPGRFERIRDQVVLDGAHNPHGSEMLAHTWWQEFPDRKATLIFSAAASKDIRSMLGTLAPLAARILFCPIDNPRTVPVSELVSALPADAPDHRTYPGFATAFAAAQTHPDPILIAGSLFLVGEARALLTGKPYRSSTQ